MRTANDIGFPSEDNFPPCGKHRVVVVHAEKWSSPKKDTPAVKLTFVTDDGDYTFSDLAFVTEKAIPRLNLIAQHLCEMPKETELPENNLNCAKFLGNYILQNAHSRKGIVTVAEYVEQYIPQTGPNAGRKMEKTKRKVSFAGYEKITDNKEETISNKDVDTQKPIVEGDEDIPF